jgi:enoyl-CoA hydratase
MLEYAVDASGHTAILTLNRPQARNAIDPELTQAIERALDELETNPDIWVGILAAVPPVFSAGADLRAIQAGRGHELVTPRGGFAGLVRRERTKPLIAAVDGPALAGGTELVLACDLVVASTAASFGIPEVKRSLVAGGGGLFRLGRAVPLNIAMECALTGDPIDAERAHHFGLVNLLCAPGEAVDAARRLGARVCANAPVAVRSSRRVVLEGTFASDDVGWQRSEEATALAVESADFQEGVAAFLEKRPARWTGN